MNKKYLVSALSIVILVGILVVAAGPLFISEKTLGTGIDEQAAPAIEANLAPAAEDSTHFDRVAAVLNQSETGSQLLKLKEIYKVGIQFEEGRGSRFQKGSNLILLDSRHDPVKAALYFAHEMVHAQTFNEGTGADINSVSRQAYINLKIQEEVKGMKAGFQVKMELERIGVRVADITFPMEDIYRLAYRLASAQASLLDNALSEQQLDTIGQAAGESALFDAFASGEIKTSNTHEPYTDYFASRWDEANGV